MTKITKLYNSVKGCDSNLTVNSCRYISSAECSYKLFYLIVF